jgi:predicted protein tyrosine phosphatase
MNADYVWLLEPDFFHLFEFERLEGAIEIAIRLEYLLAFVSHEFSKRSPVPGLMPRNESGIAEHRAGHLNDRMLKVLMVCTGNQDRSPTAAALLAEMRAPMWVASAGTSPSCLNRLSRKLLEEADVICAMEDEHRDYIGRHFGHHLLPKIKVLHVRDVYSRGETRLKDHLRERLKAALDLPFGVG